MPGIWGKLNKEKYCFKKSHLLQTQRPHSDIYGEFPNQLQKSTSSSNVDSSFDFAKVRNDTYILIHQYQLAKETIYNT